MISMRKLTLFFIVILVIAGFFLVPKLVETLQMQVTGFLHEKGFLTEPSNKDNVIVTPELEIRVRKQDVDWGKDRKEWKNDKNKNQ